MAKEPSSRRAPWLINTARLLLLAHTAVACGVAPSSEPQLAHMEPHSRQLMPGLLQVPQWQPGGPNDPSTWTCQVPEYTGSLTIEPDVAGGGALPLPPGSGVPTLEVQPTRVVWERRDDGGLQEASLRLEVVGPIGTQASPNIELQATGPIEIDCGHGFAASCRPSAWTHLQEPDAVRLVTNLSLRWIGQGSDAAASLRVMSPATRPAQVPIPVLSPPQPDATPTGTYTGQAHLQPTTDAASVALVEGLHRGPQVVLNAWVANGQVLLQDLSGLVVEPYVASLALDEADPKAVAAPAGLRFNPWTSSLSGALATHLDGMPIHCAMEGLVKFKRMGEPTPIASTFAWPPLGGGSQIFKPPAPPGRYDFIRSPPHSHNSEKFLTEHLILKVPLGTLF